MLNRRRARARCSLRPLYDYAFESPLSRPCTWENELSSRYHSGAEIDGVGMGGWWEVVSAVIGFLRLVPYCLSCSISCCCRRRCRRCSSSSSLVMRRPCAPEWTLGLKNYSVNSSSFAVRFDKPFDGAAYRPFQPS